MIGFIMTAVAAAALVAIGGFVAYEGEGAIAKCAGAAMGLMLISTLALPAIKLAAELSELDIDSILDGIGSSAGGEDNAYYETAEQSFCEGVRRFLCEEFDLDGEEVEVVAFDFDFENMRAGTVRVILRGRAALADARAISAAVTDGGLGKCEVKIEAT